MTVHYSNKNCGTPDTVLSKSFECKCLMNVNGVCKRETMQDFALLMIKDGNDEYVTNCPYFEGFLMASEFRIKSNII